MKQKIRLDELLVQCGLCETVQQAAGLIGAGEVFVNAQREDKVGSRFLTDCVPEIREKCPYVSRGGYKLQGGLEGFSFDPKGMICADIGASSGGFTDCLLQNGAAKVYAVDVAYGQLDWKLRQDERVIVIERFNARNISKKEIPEPLNLAVIDAAFISVTKLLPPLLPLFTKTVAIICLIKPQFELPKKLIPKGGVVQNPEHHQLAVDSVTSFVQSLGVKAAKVVPSPIRGPKGNREFLLHITS